MSDQPTHTQGSTLMPSCCVTERMRVDFPRIDPDLTLEDARDRLFHEGAERLVVATEEGILGLVSPRDLAAADVAGVTPTQSVRSILRAPTCCGATASVPVVTRRLASAGVTSAFVVADGQAIGVFAPGDRRRAPRPAQPSSEPSSGGQAPVGRSVAARRATVGALVAGRGAMPSAELGRLFVHVS